MSDHSAAPLHAVFPFALIAFLVPAFASAASPASKVGARVPGEEVEVLGDGRFVLARVDAPLSLTAGLWVGALADRGAGEEAAVSGTVFSDDFVPVSMHPHSEAHVRYTDVGVSRPGHQPLGLEVTQVSSNRQFRADGFLGVSYRLRNVSDRVDPAGQGWDLRRMYVGILANPDIGLADPLEGRWSDDHVAVASDPHGRSFGYAFDAPGSGDDTPIQFGVALLRRPLHRFAVLSAPEPSSDEGRYLWMRGDSNDAPTLDPASTRGDDYRFLVAVGPLEDLAPGETVVVQARLLLGHLVPSDGPGAGQPRLAAEARGAAVPNPVSLSSSRVLLRGVPGERALSVYSVAGRLVRRLDGSSAGSRTWDLRADDGALVPAGVYFVRLSGAREPVGRIVVVR